MGESMIIDRRFRGPADSGNGGWTSGALAGFADGPAEVTLRLPPPLDTELQVVRSGETARLIGGDRTFAEVAPVTGAASGEFTWVPFVEPAQALAAQARFAGLDEHPFPMCFTCGTARAVGDGLRIFTGPLADGSGAIAATWTPDESVAESGRVPEPIVWAALDCPSGWPNMADGTIALLGRMAAVVERAPAVGEPCVVVGASTGVAGRKLFASSSLYTGDGEPLATARATWITVGARH